MRAIIIFILIILAKICFSQNKLTVDNNFECISETRVSGLFQFKRKFLKETEFFPSKTTFNFRKNFALLTEKEITREKKFEAKYQFECKKNENFDVITCKPIDKNNTYSIKFSLDTLRYRKTLITDYWLNGKGNEIDYVHIAHGYCYEID